MPAFGETRQDGMRFRGYQTQNGRCYEQWLSPEAWEARRQRQTDWRRNDYRNRPEVHRAKGRDRMARNRKADPVRFALTAARCRAKKAGIPFTITAADITIPEFCPVFGVLLTRGNSDECNPEIDRIVNDLGYVPGNVLVISRRANRLKSDATLAEMQTLAYFYENLSKENGNEHQI